MSNIVWPERFTPGITDNYVSNEVIVAGLTAADVWPCLNDTSVWPKYYTAGIDAASGERDVDTFARKLRRPTFRSHATGDRANAASP